MPGQSAGYAFLFGTLVLMFGVHDDRPLLHDRTAIVLVGAFGITLGPICAAGAVAGGGSGDPGSTEVILLSDRAACLERGDPS